MSVVEEGADARASSSLEDAEERLSRDGQRARRRPIGLRQVIQGDDVLGVLPDLVGRMSIPGPVLVLADAVFMSRDGTDLKSYVVSLLSGHDARLVTLGQPGEELHADMAAVDAARAALAGAGCVVAVGSGTLCDIGKKATEGPPAVPYIVVQTACSVNAFSDDMAVLLLHGAKRTKPSRWPDALVIDLGVIADAPAELNQAGVGELTSMFTGPSDWRLADLAGLDPSYDEAVVGMFRDGAEELERIAPGVAMGDRDALAWLCDRMTLSGLALGVAGRTAPISGAEHAISHLLDMAAIRTGVPTGYHGAQVGVATVVVAALWEDLLEDIDPARLLDEPPDPQVARAGIEQRFGVFDPSGETAEECWRLYQRKLAAWTAGRAAREALVADWDRHIARVTDGLCSPASIVGMLRAAGAPATFRDLGVDAGAARWAVGGAHLLRDRFGVLDLADLAGRWQPADVDRVLERAAAVGGGL
ncbi:MAG: iron-containing alcohol dehydrogenase [Candidatus Limnocylindrales bacterium]